MDKDLIDYLDQRFSALDQRFEQIDQRFDQVDRRFEQIDQRFGQVDQRFGQVDQRFEQMDQRFEKMETEVRRAYVAIEDLRGQVRQVADGVANVGEQLSRHREEVAQRFDDGEALNRRSYEDLDSRVHRLEATG
jgi:chromosome segregation ATPase